MSNGVTDAEYRALAEFRHQIRCFLRFSEHMARDAGLEPQQHQLLVAVRGMPAGSTATIGQLAERLQLKHHSTVELIDRLEARGLVRRESHPADRRLVIVRLTPSGHRLLPRLARAHRTELRMMAPGLLAALHALLGTEPAVRPERNRAAAR